MDGEWDLNVQRMIDYIERNLEDELALADVARRLGYSNSWCTRQFHRMTGQTMRGYIRERRLSEAAAKLRDGDRGILDIAIEAGFSSQAAFSRAFAATWGVSPGAWRESREPICLRLPRRTYFPSPRKEGREMDASKKIEISIQEAPERLFVGLWAEGAEDYFGFWREIAKRGLDCEKVSGALAGLTANAQIGGWLAREGRRGYLYGVEMEAGYSGPLPEGMESFMVPAGSYAVFRHPPYDYEREDSDVWEALKKAVAAWSPAAHGWRQDESLPTWQRHDPAKLGQAWCMPLRRAVGAS
jgi:AraC-type DNA-binding domain-containing proteins